MNRTMENENEGIEELSENLSLCEYLAIIGFDANKFNIPLQFWFDLNTLTDDEWFVLTDEMIQLIGFKSSESGQHHSRSNFFAFLRKNFSEGLDFIKTSIAVSRTGRGGAHHKIEIQMKKRPFKKMLLKVGTSTSDLIHDYLLDIEAGCMKYALYQEQCKSKLIIEENRKLKRLRIEEESAPELDLSPFPEISVQSYDKLSVLYLIYLKQHYALKFGISDNIAVRIQQHCRTLGVKQGDVKLVYILSSTNSSIIESSLKHCAIMNGWKKDDIVINGAVQSEIIDLNKTTIQTVIDIIEQFNTQHNQLMREKEEEIVKRSNDLEKFRIQSELELQSKRLDLEFKLICVDAEIANKRIEAEVENKRIELESKKLDIRKLEIESKKSKIHSHIENNNTMLNYYDKK